MNRDDDERARSTGGRPTFEGRVAVSETGPAFAYVPGRVLVRGEAVRRLPAIADHKVEIEERDDLRPDREAPQWLRARVLEDQDPLKVVEALRAEGLDAQPEHVFFAHCGGCEGAPHPSLAYDILAGDFGADPYRANPYRANPYRANPYRANPYRANPYRANPYRANPYRANAAPLSTAEPAAARTLPTRPPLPGGTAPRVVILDTGLAGGLDETGKTNPDAQRPALLDVAGASPRIHGAIECPDEEITPVPGGQAFASDGYLNPVAGHGTFIAGLIEQLAQGCAISVRRVIEPLGDGAELEIVKAIEEEAGRAAGERPHLISMSFGGPVLEEAGALRSAIAAARLKGIVLVASAGNDGVSIPQFPAAFPDVVGVGAVGPEGPPPWTNYGDWVDACAPGVELVSAFFRSFDGAFPMMNSVDIDRFAEWACWSGTSFAGPVVVAALAREMAFGGCDADEAVRRVVRAPHLLRIPCLGTVVNI